MEREPNFIKEFSAGERQEKAKEIIKVRKKDRLERENITSSLNDLHLETNEQDKELTNQLKELNQLNQKIEEMNTKGVSRWLNIFKLRNLRSQLEIGKKTYEELQAFQQQNIVKSDQLSGQVNQQKLSSRGEIRDNLDQFYLDQIKKWERSGYNNDEIKQYFTEDYLSKLTILIASQTAFSGQLNTPGGDYWNDQWIWVNESRGLSLDVGLVFLPEKAKVDVNTGSRYEIDENKNPIVNLEYIDKIKQVADSPDFEDYSEAVMKITDYLHLRYIDKDSIFSDRENQAMNKLSIFRQRLESEFQIYDERLQNVLLDYQNLERINLYKNEPSNFHNIDTETISGLTYYGILYKESKNTVDSKDFWESYFNQNPKARPSKIIYYPEKDPGLD